MKNRKYVYALGFWLVATCLTLFLWGIEKKAVSGVRLMAVVDALTQGYQIKQIITIVIMFAVGWIAVYSFTDGLNDIWTGLLAFPVGAALWSTLSYLVLLLNIPYTAFIMFLAVFIFMGATAFIHRKKIRMIDGGKITRQFLYAVGAAEIGTTGLLFTTMSSDSYHFVMQFGEMIAKLGRYDADANGEFLLSTGQSVALLSSLAVFCGFETIYGIHHMLMISFMGLFCYSLYENLKDHIEKKWAAILAVLFGILLLVTQAVSFLMGWVISSAYFMVYLYVFVYLVYKQYIKKGEVLNLKLLFLLITSMIVLTRGEGGMLICLVIICMTRLKIDNKDLLCYFTLPCAVIQLSYYIKLVFDLKIYESDFLSPSTMLGISGIIILTNLYILIIRNRYFMKLQQHLYGMIIGAFCVILGGLLLVFPERLIENFQVTIHNLGNEYWSYLPWILCMFLILEIKAGVKLDFLHIVWIGLMLFNFAISGVRFIGLRVGIGDSFNRILIALVPIIVLSFAVNLSEKYGERQDIEI